MKSFEEGRSFLYVREKRCRLLAADIGSTIELGLTLGTMNREFRLDKNSVTIVNLLNGKAEA